MAERNLDTKKYENDQKQLSSSIREEKRLEKVVTGTARTRKKSEMRKFADVFISEDATSVKSRIVMDILVPTIKTTISEIVKTSIDILLFGESRRSDRRSVASKVSYSRYYNEPNDRREQIVGRSRNSFDYDDIVFSSRGDAEAVLSAMEDSINQFGIVSVGDLYDLAEISTNNYAINNYGWTDLRSADIVRLRTGEYIIKLPKALPIG